MSCYKPYWGDNGKKHGCKHHHHHDHKDQDFCKKVCKCKCCDCDDSCSSVCDPKKNKYCFDPTQCKSRRYRCAPRIRYAGTPSNFVYPEEAKVCTCKDMPKLEETTVMLPLVQDEFEFEMTCVSTSATFASAFPSVTNPSMPYTFQFGGNAGSSANICNLTIEPIPGRPDYARIRGDLSFPVTLTYVDNNNNIQAGTTSVTIAIDTEMEAPMECRFPYDAEAFAEATVKCAPITFTGDVLTSTINLTMDVTWELYLIVTRPCTVYTDGSCNNVCDPDEADDEDDEFDCEPWCPKPGCKWPPKNWRGCGSYGCNCGCGCGGCGGC